MVIYVMRSSKRANIVLYKEVMRLRDVERQNFRQIGEKFGFSRQRAYEVYKRACDRLKKPVQSQGLSRLRVA